MGFGLDILGSVGSSIWDFGMDMANKATTGAINNHYSREMMRYQDKLNRAYGEDAAGISRRSYEKADMNPMLAYNNSAQQAVYSGSGDVGSGQQSDIAGKASQLAQTQSNIALQEKQGQSVEDQGNAAVLNATTSALKAQAEIPKIMADTRLSGAQKQEVMKKMKVMDAQIGQIAVQNDLAHAQSAYTRAKTTGQHFDNVATGHTARGIMDFENTMSNHPNVRKVYNTIKTAKNDFGGGYSVSKHPYGYSKAFKW